MDTNNPSINWNADNLDSVWTALESHAVLMCKGPIAAETSENIKCVYLLIWVGAQGREIFSTFEFAAAEKDNIKAYLKKFRDYAAHQKIKYSFAIYLRSKTRRMLKILTNTYSRAQDPS